MSNLDKKPPHRRRPAGRPMNTEGGLARLAADEGGAIAIIVALAMLVLIGVAAMALDFSQIYLARSIDQRIADQSALAAAFAYSQATANNTTAAQHAASSLATTNGAGTSTVSTQIVNSPSGDGNKAAQVTVTTAVALSPFGRFITTSPTNPSGTASLNVTATSYAEIQNAVAPCIIAMNSGGVAASGGSTVTATSCAIASDGNVTATNGPVLSGQAVYAVGTISPTSCSSACVKSAPTGGQIYPGSSAPVDPYASSNIFSRLSTVSGGLTAATFPTATVGSAPTGGSSPGSCSGTQTIPVGSYTTISTSYYPVCTAITFTGGSGTTTSVSGSGLSLSGNSITVNFGAGGVYKLNGLSISGSNTAVINIGTGATLEIWNGFSVSGSSSLTVNGPGTYYVQGGISNSASGAMNFNNSHNTSGRSIFWVAGGINMSGAGSFPDGVYNITSGSSATSPGITDTSYTVTFGNGSFNINDGISTGGSSNLTFGTQGISSDVFQVAVTPASGSSAGVAISTGGGGSLTIGSFPNIDLNGAMNVTGNLNLGAGVYTINGAFDAAASGGDSITGGTSGAGGNGTQIIAAGQVTLGQGYDSVSLTAPTALSSSSEGQFATVALASQSSLASSITQGASGTDIVGALYLPNSPLTLSGAGALSAGGSCLIVVASTLTISGAGSVSTNCPNLSTTSAGSSVSLIE